MTNETQISNAKVEMSNKVTIQNLKLFNIWI